MRLGIDADPHGGAAFLFYDSSDAKPTSKVAQSLSR
jgi:hypothetical protein